MDRLGRRRRRRAARAVPVPGHAGGRGAAREPVPVPLGRVRRAGLGLRTRGRPAHGRADLRAGVGADGRRARRPAAARRPGHRRARRGPVRHRPGRGPVRPVAAGRGTGPGRGRGDPAGRSAALAARRVGSGRRCPLGVRRVPSRGGVSRRLVPQPALVPAGRVRRRAARPGHLRPDAARQPAHEHGVREVLQLAAGAEPGLPGGNAACVRRRGRPAGRPGPDQGPAPGRSGLRAEPAGRYRAPAATERDLTGAASTGAQAALNLALCLVAS